MCFSDLLVIVAKECRPRPVLRIIVLAMLYLPAPKFEEEFRKVERDEVHDVGGEAVWYSENTLGR